MHSKDFPEANHALAKDQPEYNTLYVHADILEANRPMIVEFVLTDEEVEKIVKSKRLYYSQSTFGGSFQPMLIMTDNPFKDPILQYEEPADENRTPAEVWDKTHYIKAEAEKEHRCSNCGKLWGEHYFSSRQCEMK